MRGQTRVKRDGDLLLVKQEIASLFRVGGAVGPHKKVTSRDVAELTIADAQGKHPFPHCASYYALGERNAPVSGKSSQFRRYQSNIFNILNGLAKDGKLKRWPSEKGRQGMVVRFHALD